MTDAPFAGVGRVLLVGCGNMGGAMLRRWVAAGLSVEDIVVVDPGSPSVPAGVRVVAVPDPAAPIETMVLAIKPQQLGSLSAATLALRSGLAISILAGVEEATLAERFGATTIVRAMPNLPVAIGKGVVALFSSRRGDDPAACATAAALMQPLGLVEWIDREDQFDAVTALSGCGPGFVFRFADALARAGEALGLGEAQARRLALATLDGAAAMAAASDEAPATLADRVASPGGSTREGLDVLDHDRALERLLIETLAASAARNRAMAIESR